MWSLLLPPPQVVTLLECFSACGVTPQPATVDHLVLQLVQGGLQHAPVAGIAQLLSVLAATQHNPGPLFVKNYAYVSGWLCLLVINAWLAAAVCAVECGGGGVYWGVGGSSTMRVVLLV